MSLGIDETAVRYKVSREAHRGGRDARLATGLADRELREQRGMTVKTRREMGGGDAIPWAHNPSLFIPKALFPLPTPIRLLYRSQQRICHP